jgi:hypothetical protein
MLTGNQTGGVKHREPTRNILGSVGDSGPRRRTRIAFLTGSAVLAVDTIPARGTITAGCAV